MIISLHDYRCLRASYGAPHAIALRGAEFSPARELIAFAMLGAPPAIWDRLHEALPSSCRRPAEGLSEGARKSLRIIFSADSETRFEATSP